VTLVIEFFLSQLSVKQLVSDG